MKPIIISPQRIKREGAYLLVAFIIANLLNVYAIITYQSRWSELISFLPLIIMLSLFLYVIIGLVRLIVFSIRKVVSG